MSAELDLTAAIHAAWMELLDQGHNGLQCSPENNTDEVAAKVLSAALPHIREQIAQQIKAVEHEEWLASIRRGDASPGRELMAFRRAARIVRGEP